MNNSVWVLTYECHKINTPPYQGISGVYASEELALARARKRVQYYGNSADDREVTEQGNVIRLLVISEPGCIRYWTATEYEVQGDENANL